jgi:hypothetical protein
MYLAAGKTLTGTGGLWAITLVATASLAFWLIMTVAVAPRRPGRGLPKAPPRAAHHLLTGQGQAPGGPGIPGPRAGEEAPQAPATATMTGPAAPADPRMATSPGATPHPDTAVTRDDMPRVPAPRADNPVQEPQQPAGGSTPRSPSAERTDMDKRTEEPGVQWTAPAPRRSATDEPVPSRQDQSRPSRDRSQD